MEILRTLVLKHVEWEKMSLVFLWKLHFMNLYEGDILSGPA